MPGGVTMVVILPYVPLGLNKIEPRCMDRHVTVTVGSNRGFEVLHEAAGRSAWTTRVMSDQHMASQPGSGPGGPRYAHIVGDVQAHMNNIHRTAQ